MKQQARERRNRAFTLIELLVVIAIVVMLLLIVPTIPGPDTEPSAACMSHLKQVSLGFILSATDHHDQFPWQMTASNGTTLELMAGGPLPHFLSLSNFLRDPKILVCPTEKVRQASAGFAGMSSTNLSYFVNLDSSLTKQPMASVLTGDRHLTINGKAAEPGLLTVTTNTAPGWTDELHGSPKAPWGVLGFADGHVQVARQNLDAVFQNTPSPTNRLAVP